jgi:hypothetical protein
VDLSELICVEALDRMVADGQPPIEAALSLVLVGLDRLEERACCDACLAAALDEIRDRLAELHHDAPAAALH